MATAKLPPVDALAQEIGKRIAYAREERLKISQQALHVRSKQADPDGVGISRAVLSLYETGTNKPGAREIRILCNTLKVTPNWLLYGAEKPLPLKAESDFLRGSDLEVTARMAFAILALDHEFRESLGQLIFSMLRKKYSDIQLSSLMTMANLLSPELLKQVIEAGGEDSNSLQLQELIDRFVTEMSESIYTNYGNLRPAVTENELSTFDPDFPPPEAPLSNKQ